MLTSVARRVISLSGAIEGYEQPELVEEIFQKTKAFEPNHGWPEIAGAATVLDFGGGCGQHYKVARCENSAIKWAVVETLAMAGRASELATDRLRFFTSISMARDWLGVIDVMHSDGAIQYTPDPAKTLHQLCSVGANEMQWRRVFLSDIDSKRERQLSLLGENGPAGRFKGKAVRYTRTSIPETSFLDAHCDYQLIERGADWFRFAVK